MRKILDKTTVDCFIIAISEMIRKLLFVLSTLFVSSSNAYTFQFPNGGNVGHFRPIAYPRIAWISPSKLWNQLGFPTAPNPEELLLSAEIPTPPKKNVDVSTYNLDSYDGVVYGSLFCQCGKPAARISGAGKEKARINDIPWTAALVEKNGWQQPFCGATLINDRYVVTAAHCINRRKPEELVIWLNDEDILLSNETLGGRMVYDVLEIIKHPQSKGYINDIALLKLNDTLKFGLELTYVNPVCLPINEMTDYADETAVVAGWGRTSSGGDVSPFLLKIDVPIIANKVCIEKSKYKDAIIDTMMCAGILESGGADACQGDSGGPLIVPRKETGAILVGVVSWGFGCAEPFSPGVYTRVSHYTEWILENTKEANWCSK